MGALDPATGRIIWQTAGPTGAWAFGPLSVANGLVYAGSMDPAGHMRALDAKTGKILWPFASGGSVASAPAIAGGMVFWGSGYTHLIMPSDHHGGAARQEAESLRYFSACAPRRAGKRRPA